MMNPRYHFARMNELIGEFQPSRERSIALVKLEECAMWLAKCKPTEEAFNRDQMAAAPTNNVFESRPSAVPDIDVQHRPGICGGPGVCVVCSA